MPPLCCYFPFKALSAPCLCVSLCLSVIFYNFFLKQPCQGACQHSALTRRTHGALSPLSDESLKAVQHSSDWWNAFCKVLNYRHKRRGKILKTWLLYLFYYFSFFLSHTSIIMIWKPQWESGRFFLYCCCCCCSSHAVIIPHMSRLWSSDFKCGPLSPLFINYHRKPPEGESQGIVMCIEVSPLELRPLRTFWWPRDAGLKHPIIRMLQWIKETLQAFLLSGWN